MYNKLFTKILDSSIWMEDIQTRLVWITFIAVMDEDGMCQFASLANLAHRARVTLAEATAAAACLEGEDEHSSDPEFGGRRIERVPGGWIVLNAEKYRRLVTREVAKEKTRERVARHREKKAREENGNAPVTDCNGAVTALKRPVTPSGSEAPSDTEAEEPPIEARYAEVDEQVRSAPGLSGFDDFWLAYPKKVGKGAAETAWRKHKLSQKLPELLTAIRAAKISVEWTKEFGQFIPNPATWLNQRRWEDQLTPAGHAGTGPNGYVPPADGKF